MPAQRSSPELGPEKNSPRTRILFNDAATPTIGAALANRPLSMDSPSQPPLSPGRDNPPRAEIHHGCRSVCAELTSLIKGAHENAKVGPLGQHSPTARSVLRHYMEPMAVMEPRAGSAQARTLRMTSPPLMVA